MLGNQLMAPEYYSAMNQTLNIALTLNIEKLIALLALAQLG